MQASAARTLRPMYCRSVIRFPVGVPNFSIAAPGRYPAGRITPAWVKLPLQERAGLDYLEPFGAPSIFAHGSFAIFAAMRRASSRVSSFAAARRPGFSSK